MKISSVARTCILVTCTVVAAVLAAQSPQTRPKSHAAMAGIWLRDLICNSTTEAGEDEVYLLVAGRTSSGRVINARIPGPSSHWDLNDGNEPRSIPQKTIPLWTGTLASGEQVDVAIMIMEEDGGSPRDWKNEIALAAEAADALSPGVGRAIGIVGFVATNFVGPDTDDYLGSIAVHLEERNGQVFASWRGIDRVTFAGHSDRRATWMFDLNGDGSNYRSYFRAGAQGIETAPGIGDDPDRYTVP